MNQARTREAIGRIERAIARIERAPPPTPPDAGLARRHAALRAAAQDAVRELDAIIGGDAGAEAD